MQHSQHSGLCAEPPRLPGQLVERLPDATEQEVVPPDIVAQEQCIERVGDGKDDMKVLGIEQFALPLPHPSSLRRPLALWASAVPAGKA